MAGIDGTWTTADNSDFPHKGDYYAALDVPEGYTGLALAVPATQDSEDLGLVLFHC